MLTSKKILAIVLCVVFALSFVACRPQNEMILTVEDSEGNDLEIKSAFYMLYMIDSDFQFKQKVDESKGADGSPNEEIDYSKEKVDEKDYTTWVKENALKLTTEYGYTELTFDNLKLKLEKDVNDYIDYYADYYWNNGYSEISEPNGISFQTYKAYFTSSFKKDEIFKHYYYKPENDETDKQKGSLRPSQEEINKAFSENYVLANSIEVQFQVEQGVLTEEQKVEALDTLKDYKAQLDKGEKFENIYNNFYDIKENDESTSEGPKDKLAIVYGSEKTDGADKAFQDVMNMKVGEVKVFEYDDKYLLALRQDIKSDPYYLENLDGSILKLLKQDEFNKSIEENSKALKATKNEGALKFYNPSKLKKVNDQNQ